MTADAVFRIASMIYDTFERGVYQLADASLNLSLVRSVERGPTR
jgi:hypothetical protein